LGKLLPGQDALELTRYTPDGEVVFRQTALQIESAPSNGNPLESSQLRVIDDDTIAVLARCPWGFQLTVLNAAGAYLWAVDTDAAELPAYGAQLAVGMDGEILVGNDGYVVKNYRERDGEIEMVSVGRSRTEYYDLELYGLHAGISGAVYSLTQEGARDARSISLERISFASGRLESARVDHIEQGCELGFGHPSQLFVTPDERAAYVLHETCFVQLDLSSLPPPAD
jgi:hypothetical protein